MRLNTITGWSRVALGDLFEPLKRKNGEGEKRVLTVSGELGLVDQSEFFDRNIASKNLGNYWLLKNDEFAYNRSFMKGYPFGAIKRLYRYDKGCVSPIYLCFSLKDENMNAKYYSYIFESGLLNQQLMGIVHAGARAHGMLNVSQDEFFEMVVPRPPEREQKKISEIISTWDRAIETLVKLIATKTNLKKGLMQKLLTGKMRFKEFKEYWTDYEYDDLFETVSGKKNQVAKEQYKKIGRYPIVDQGQPRIVGYTDEDKVFQNVPVIVFGDHTRIIKWVDFPFVVGADGTQLLKTKSICDLKYGFYMLSNLRLPNLGYSRHFKVVKESTFYVPSNPKEQTKIEGIFSLVDHELDFFSSMLETLKRQKKGLMQKLLTGKIRVKI